MLKSIKKISINKLINYCIIGLFFVAPITRNGVNIVASLILILWLIEGNYRHKIFLFNSRITPSLIFFLITIFILGISIFWSDTLEGGFWSKNYSNAIEFYFAHYIVYLLLVPIILTSFDIKNTNYAINAFLLAIFVSEITSYGIIFDLWTTRYGSVSSPSPFQNHAIYTTLLTIAIFILLNRFFQETKINYKLLTGLFLMTAITNLFMNGGRTGQVAFLIVLFVFIVYKYKLDIKYFLIFLILSFSSYTVAYNSSTLFQKRTHAALHDIKAITDKNYNSSWGLRFQSGLVTLSLMKNSLILGYGLGNAKHTFHNFVNDNYDNGKFFSTIMDTPHNQYSEFLLDGGLLALIPFLIFIFLFIKEKKKNDLQLISIIFIVAFCFMFMTKSVFEHRLAYVLFIIVTTILSMNRLPNR